MLSHMIYWSSVKGCISHSPLTYSGYIFLFHSNLLLQWSSHLVALKSSSVLKHSLCWQWIDRFPTNTFACIYLGSLNMILLNRLIFFTHFILGSWWYNLLFFIVIIFRSSDINHQLPRYNIFFLFSFIPLVSKSDFTSKYLVSFLIFFPSYFYSFWPALYFLILISCPPFYH